MKYKFLKNQQYAVVLGNGSYPEDEYIREIVRSAHFILCADRGADKAKELGIRPDVILGDLDSISSDTMNYFCKLNVIVTKVDSQEENDLEKCITFLKGKNNTGIVLLGFIGSRDDHNLATLQIAKKYVHEMRIVIISESAEMFFLLPGDYEFDVIGGQIISLFGFPRAESITTKGLKYPLDNDILEEGSRGVSNQAITEKIMIKFRSGILLVVKMRKIL